jgi:omega-amidase
MKFKAALIQSMVCKDKQRNIENAVNLIKSVSKEEADLAVFPEMFNCPYDNSYFREYGEPEGGYCFESMSKAAKESGIYVVAGSMPELEGNHVYNTSYVFDRKGEKIAKHRKMHLFDIDVEGGITNINSCICSCKNSCHTVAGGIVGVEVDRNCKFIFQGSYQLICRHWF